MELHFDKMEGCGNDFVVLDQLRESTSPALDAHMVRRLGDRRLGVGFDQLLVIHKAPEGVEPNAAYAIYNADGTRAEQCGNGARCVAALLHERHGFPDDFAMQSPAGPISAKVRRGNVAVSMGVPDFGAAAIPLAARPQEDGRYRLEVVNETVTLSAVSMGNPHGVLRVDDVEVANVERLGPAIQQLSAFPDGVNVGFLQILDKGHGKLRVVERGAGETPACGSGASAAAAIGLRAGWFTGPTVHLSLRGGELVVSWPGEGHQLWLEGAARWVFKGQITL